MRCSTAHTLMTKRLHEPLTPEEGLQLSRHLEACPACEVELPADAQFERGLRHHIAGGALAARPLVVDPGGILRHLRGVRRGQQRARATFVRLAAGSAAAAALAFFAGAVRRPDVPWTTGRLPERRTT